MCDRSNKKNKKFLIKKWLKIFYFFFKKVKNIFHIPTLTSTLKKKLIFSNLCMHHPKIVRSHAVLRPHATMHATRKLKKKLHVQKTNQKKNLKNYLD